ncbi:MAG: 5'/3'-nucleotidase SurE [Methanobacteriaceae archaeon]|nr:5'/3'-nucleotidase SurE [Methanobacteriaceae archaeon]
MKNILISNDDGVLAPGIFAAKCALDGFSDVTVVAPQENNSGVGRMLSLFKPLNLKEYALEDGFRAYGVSGSPADAVNIGINYVLDDKPDLVVTGINTGVNIGKCEITTSGTVCAALEAVCHGVPAIACSLFIDPSSFIQDNDGQWRMEVDFEFAKEVLSALTKRVLKKGMPEGIDLLNLNIPAKPVSNEIKVTKLAERMLRPNIISNDEIKEFGVNLDELDNFNISNLDDENNNYVMIAPHLIEEYDEGTDGYCLMVEKRPSLTPLNIDLTGDLESLEKWL